MDTDKLIKKSIKSRDKALSESDSKLFLKKFQIPVIEEIIVSNKNETVKAAEKIGFPVVVKGLGAKLLHKTELGLVHLNLTDSQSVEKAVISITEKGEDK